MADNIKKTSELATTNTASGSDRVVILKDPAGIPSTRTITFDNLANTIYEKVLVPNTVVVSNVISVMSNGSSNVAFFTFNSNTYCAVDMDLHSHDPVTGEHCIAKVYFMANSTDAISLSTEIDMGGPSQIHFDPVPTINTSTRNVTCYFRRDNGATNNIEIRYVAVQHKHVE
jgi:hypothetical protein